MSLRHVVPSWQDERKTAGKKHQTFIGEGFARMNRVVLLQHLAKQMCALMGKEQLTDVEYGNLAMAVQGLESELKAEQYVAAIDRCVERSNLPEACYRTMIKIYQDWENRVAPSQDPAYCDIIKEIWRLKQGKGNNGSLNSFVLIKRYSDFPEFYSLNKASNGVKISIII